MDEKIISDIRDYLKRIAECLEGKSYLLPATPEPTSIYTLHAWLNEWFNTYKKPMLKPNTLGTYDVAIRVHIKPNMPDVPLNQLDGLQIQKFLLAIDKSRTRKTVYDVFNMAMKTACDLKLIKDNPLQGVKIPVHHREQGNALTKQEERAFLKAIKGHPTETYFKLLLWTGCRRNEILFLEASDVDFKNKIMRIRGTKTEGSNRVIPLFENVNGLLVDFPHRKGDMAYFDFRPDYVTRIFKRYCPAHKLHDLRHTFATRCLDAGISLKVVQKWLGHSQIDTTADIYTHVSKETHTKEADKLNKFMTKGKTAS